MHVACSEFEHTRHTIIENTFFELLTRKVSLSKSGFLELSFGSSVCRVTKWQEAPEASLSCTMFSLHGLSCKVLPLLNLELWARFGFAIACWHLRLRNESNAKGNGNFEMERFPCVAVIFGLGHTPWETNLFKILKEVHASSPNVMMSERLVGWHCCVSVLPDGPQASSLMPGNMILRTFGEHMAGPSRGKMVFCGETRIAVNLFYSS